MLKGLRLQVVEFTESLALLEVQYRIHINSVCVGPVHVRAILKGANG